jgi:hypothetical protein
MSTFRTPVGPQPSTVYWRRRLLVGLGLLAVLVAVLLVIFRPTGTAPAASESSAAPTSEPVEAEMAACDPADVALEAVTDKTRYAASEQPLISMTITNIGTEACIVNAGTDVQEYRITSGTDQIWTSKDCQTSPAENEVVLEPSEPQSTTPFPWERVRSSSTTCAGESRPSVLAGSYHLTVYLGDIQSDGTRQFLLD